MKIYNFSSGSSGNCYVISHEGISLMIECGIPYKKIIENLARIGMSFNDIRFCLISHFHQDHSSAYDNLKEKRVKVGRLTRKYVTNDLEVVPIDLYHGKDTSSSGYLIRIKNEYLFFATDFSRFNNVEDLAMLRKIPLDYVMIECNWEDELIESATKDSKIKRQMDTHLGLSGCIDYLCALNIKTCKEIYLMHLSDKFSNEIKMQALVHEACKIKTYVCKKNGGVW